MPTVDRSATRIWPLSGSGGAWPTGSASWPSFAVTLGLAALAAAWMLWMYTWRTPWIGDRRGTGVYCAGLIALIAVLALRSPWFAGFFGFTGYLHAWHLLRGRWRLAGVVATAAATGHVYLGGFPLTTGSAIASYLLLVVVMTGLVTLFSSTGEITAQQSSQRKAMVERLAETNRRLEATLRENAGLHAQLLIQAREAGVLDERQRMAREIHDTLAQGLAGIVTQVQAARKARDEPAEWGRHLDNADRLARESLSDARRSVHAVVPQVLESARLPDALTHLVAQWEDLNGVRAGVTTTGAPRPLDRDVEVAVLRAAQESLANVARHAHASRVVLTLSYMDDGVRLDVRDDGVGFDPTAAGNGGYGLTAMGQRVGSVAGSVEIESEPGEGTAVSVSVPAIERTAGDG